jgi:hypothetical protein
VRGFNFLSSFFWNRGWLWDYAMSFPLKITEHQMLWTISRN